MILQDLRLTHACHHYSVRLCIKGNWRALADKASAKDGFGGGGKKNSKKKK